MNATIDTTKKIRINGQAIERIYDPSSPNLYSGDPSMWKEAIRVLEIRIKERDFIGIQNCAITAARARPECVISLHTLEPFNVDDLINGRIADPNFMWAWVDISAGAAPECAITGYSINAGKSLPARDKWAFYTGYSFRAPS